MLKLLLLQPNCEIASFVGAVIKSALTKARCSFELSTFHNTEKPMQGLLNDSYCYDILILSTEEQSSLLLAKIVRDTNSQASILFIGQNLSVLPSLLRFKPSGIILDPASPKDILNNLRTVYREQVHNKAYFTIKTRESIIKIPYKDILYLESSQRMVTLHTTKKKMNYYFYAKLDDVYSKLPIGVFIRCHQSFIVNMLAVERLDKITKQFILRSGEESIAVDISKRFYNNVAGQYEIFNTDSS